jgi:hypothetical protein
MYFLYDSTTGENIGPFNDYESAQMFLLYASEDLPDGGASITIESVTEPEEWAMNNGINMAITVE